MVHSRTTMSGTAPSSLMSRKSQPIFATCRAVVLLRVRRPALLRRTAAAERAPDCLVMADLKGAFDEHLAHNPAIVAWEQLEERAGHAARTGFSVAQRESKDAKRCCGLCGGLSALMCFLVAPLQIIACLCSMLPGTNTSGTQAAGREAGTRTPQRAPAAARTTGAGAPAAWFGVPSACWVLPDAEGGPAAAGGLRQRQRRIHPTGEVLLLQVRAAAPQLLVQCDAVVQLRGVAGVVCSSNCTVLAVLSRQEFLLCARPSAGSALEAVAMPNCAMRVLAATATAPGVPRQLRKDAKAFARSFAKVAPPKQRRARQARRPATPQGALRPRTPGVATFAAQPSHKWAVPGLRSDLSHHGGGRPLPTAKARY